MDRIANLPTYVKVFVALAVITAVEVWIAGVPASPFLIAVALIAMALAKAALVALYYMHLRYDRPLLGYIAITPFVLAAVMVLIVLSDRTLQAGP